MSQEDFETRADFKLIIAAARNAKPLPVPAGFTDGVMRKIAGATKNSKNSAPLFQKWMCVSSNRELGQCFLVSGFFFLVLALMLYRGLYSLPEASWMWWPAAGGLVASLLFGALGFSIIINGYSTFRVAAISVTGCIATLIVLAAMAASSTTGPFKAGIIVFFILVYAGPSAFLSAIVHRYRSEHLCREKTAAMP